MFAWLKQKIAEFRFERSFQRYERELREKHLLEAQRRFGAVELRQEVDALDKKIELEADQHFSEELRSFGSTIDECARELRKLEAQLKLFKRNYKNELALHYQKLNQIKEQISDLYDDKQDAIERRDRAKVRSQGWHDKSKRSILGNKGKQLPRHSMWGQSFGDLESYKSDRADASREIASCSEEISELVAQKKMLGRQIGEAKRCHDKMHALRNSGVTREGLSNAISSHQQEISQLRAGKAVLEGQRVKFVEAARHQNGVVTRQERISALDEQKSRYIAAFETKIAHRRRRVRFRQAAAESSQTS